MKLGCGALATYIRAATLDLSGYNDHPQSMKSVDTSDMYVTKSFNERHQMTKCKEYPFCMMMRKINL